MAVYVHHLCRLGPANTRLLAAYMNFDSRMAILVPCVRLWARGWGIRRRQLNNYSLSLMLIHSLQHTSPPILPCLQVSQYFLALPWLVTGESYRIQECGPRICHGLAARDFQCQLSSICTWMAVTALTLILVLFYHLPTQPHLVCCHFTRYNSHSLPFPSSAAQLLLHFFNYYTHFSFSEKVVAIHTPSPPLISNNSGGQSTGFRVSSLCVQDPFEQTHNVTKNMKASHLSPLRQAFESSEKILRHIMTNELTARQDVLSLFKQQTLPVPDKKRATGYSLDLDAATAGCLLLNTHYTALANRLSELDRSNGSVQCMLNHVLLQSLALLLQREFGFRVHAAEAQEESLPSIPCTHPLDLEVPAGKQRKRQRPSEECEEVMEIDEDLGGGEVKRSRLSEQESAEQLLFRLAEGERAGYTVVCSAMEESWLHRRRKRREKERLGSASSGDAVPSTPTPTTTTPCLSFTLTSIPTPTSLYLATVDLCVTDPTYQQSFQQFFAVLKKWMLYSLPSQLSTS